jgi:TRAP-type mannitol/chloroaromatic compound transport system permease small subunit
VHDVSIFVFFDQTAFFRWPINRMGVRLLHARRWRHDRCPIPPRAINQQEPTTMLERIERFYQVFNRILGKILAIVFLLMTLNVFYDVVMRYFFHNSSVGMQEMEWHLFSIVILYGVSVALLDEGHVRVDFLYDRYPQRAKAMINIIGTVFFLVPLACLVLFGSFDFVKDSYEIKEISENPGGLPYRFAIKAMIPVSFGVLIFTAIGYTIKNILLFKKAGSSTELQILKEDNT